MRAKNRVPRELRRQKFSVLGEYHQALVLIKKLASEEKDLHKHHMRMMKRYSEEAIDKLNEEKLRQEEKHPEKAEAADKGYRKKAKKLVEEYVKDLDPLYDLYIDIFSKLDQIVLFDDRVEARDLLFVQKLLEKAASMHHDTVFSEKAIRHLKVAWKHIEKRIKYDIKHDYRNDIYESKDKKPRHMGFLNTRSDKSLGKNMKKHDKKLSKKNEYWKWLGEKLQRELDENKVMPDFILLFEGLLEEFGEIKQDIRAIRLDAQLLIHHHVIEHNKESARSLAFMRMMHGMRSEVDIPKSLQEKIERFYGDDEHHGIGERAIAWANREARNERVLFGEVKKDDRLVDRFIDAEEDKIKHLRKETDKIVQS